MGETMGSRVRSARQAKGWTLREAALRLEIPPSYLSDIENDRRLPSENAKRQFQDVLEVSIEDMERLDGRLEPEIRRWAEQTPEVRHLLRKMKDAKVDVQDVEKSLDEVLKRKK